MGIIPSKTNRITPLDPICLSIPTQPAMSNKHHPKITFGVWDAVPPIHHKPQPNEYISPKKKRQLKVICKIKNRNITHAMSEDDARSHEFVKTLNDDMLARFITHINDNVITIRNIQFNLDKLHNVTINDQITTINEINKRYRYNKHTRQPRKPRKPPSPPQHPFATGIADSSGESDESDESSLN
jgi:hypothetical protein